MASDDRNRDWDRCYDLYAAVRENTDWTSQQDPEQIDSQLERLSDGRMAEIFFEVPGSAGNVSLRLPGERPGAAAELLLDVPLDSSISGQAFESGFLGRISTIHEGIASRHCAGYVAPVADVSLVLRGAVPFDYEPDTLVATLGAIDETADAITDLHLDLDATLSAHSPA